MEPPTIVEIDVLADRAGGFMSIHPRPIRDRFCFESAEKAFDGRVVPAVADAAHARRDPMAGKQILIGPARVLNPAVGVMQQRGAGPSVRERLVESGGHELLGRRAPHGPSDDAPRGEVEHDREIAPAVARRTGRHICGPDGVDRRDRKATTEPIGGDRIPVRAVRGNAEAPTPSSIESRRAH